MGEFRDRQASVPVTDRRLRAGATDGGAGDHQKPQVVVHFVPPRYPLAGGKESAQFNERRNPVRARFSEERSADGRPEPQGPYAEFVVDEQEKVGLEECAGRAILHSRPSNLRTAQQNASPPVGRRVADRTEEGLPGVEGPGPGCECRFEGIAVRSAQPGAVVFERRTLATPAHPDP